MITDYVCETDFGIPGQTKIALSFLAFILLTVLMLLLAKKVIKML